MPTALIDGITTRYDVLGSGEPLLLFSPGGLNARLDNWTEQGSYRRIKPVEHLSEQYTCIVYDRRESGQSGGRVEHLAWSHHAAQAKGLLDHLGIEQAHVMGGCLGCSAAVAFAVAHPEMVRSMVLYWPAGGTKYRIAQQAKFAGHLAYVQQDGLGAVAELARTSDKHFGQDPRVGPWASVIRSDPAFASTFRALDPDRYCTLISGIARTLIDRDTVAGAEPEDLMVLDLPALVIPGNDESHGTSAARYLEECLPAADYWDVGVADQTEWSVPPRIAEFLGSVSSQD